MLRFTCINLNAEDRRHTFLRHTWQVAIKGKFIGVASQLLMPNRVSHRYDKHSVRFSPVDGIGFGGFEIPLLNGNRAGALTAVADEIASQQQRVAV